MRRSDTGTPARTPDAEGHLLRDGVRVRWEAYGARGPAVLLLPSWTIVHSRMWKAQVPYLARHARVVTFDARGSGLSDAPSDQAAYADAETVADAVAILDHLGIATVVAAGLSRGGRYALELAAAHPARVRAVVAISPAVPHLTEESGWRERADFDAVLDTGEGWAKDNRHYWDRDFRGFVEFFFGQALPEPHSSKALEDAIAWGLDTTPEVLAMTRAEQGFADRESAEALCRSVSCPVVVVQGSEDQLVPPERGARVAELTGGRLVVLEGSGHLPQARDPVAVNLLLRDVVCGPQPPPRWVRPRARPRRALVVCSPIGLGHAWRDVRIADELRRRVPGLVVEWLAQDPVTRVLEARGELVHPASAELASESAHIDAEAGEHRLHAFAAIRRMDEILCANFMLFHDVVREDRYDLWIGDEAWELDRFLHENPELKTAPFAWLTDFVGWLPIPAGGEREAALCADENADMLERDRALPARARRRAVPRRAGRHRRRRVRSRPPVDPGVDRAPPAAGRLRGHRHRGRPRRRCARLRAGRRTRSSASSPSAGRAPEARCCAAPWPRCPRCAPGFRDCGWWRSPGPRLDPASLPAVAGLEVRGYVHEQHRLAVACDVALVQGGLATTMELVAAGRPFVAVPLEDHFEQQRHVRHRLDRHGARTWLPWAQATPEALAGAVAGALAAGAVYRPPRPDAAALAADALAGLLVAGARG